jgi:hypothetical protein
VLSACDDGTARAWDRRTGKPITPPLPINAQAISLVVTPDGKHAVVGGATDALAVLDLRDLTPTGSDPDGLCRWAELLAGQRLHEGGGTVNLSADEWLERWRAYRQQSPGDARLDSRAGNRPEPGSALAPLAGRRPTDR